MAVIKKAKDKRGGPAQKDVLDITMPSISYSNDKLADLIVDLWANASPEKPRDAVLARGVNGLPTQTAVNKATALVNAKTGMKLTRAVIITEDEHDNDYVMQADDEVVFVLPDKARVGSTASSNELLETAKLLMACTPNGI